MPTPRDGPHFDWDAPARTTPLGDIEAMRGHGSAHGVPVDSPGAWPGLVEIWTTAGEYVGIGRLSEGRLVEVRMDDGRIIPPE